MRCETINGMSSRDYFLDVKKRWVLERIPSNLRHQSLKLKGERSTQNSNQQQRV